MQSDIYRFIVEEEEKEDQKSKLEIEDMQIFVFVVTDTVYFRSSAFCKEKQTMGYLHFINVSGIEILLENCQRVALARQADRRIKYRK